MIDEIARMKSKLVIYQHPPQVRGQRFVSLLRLDVSFIEGGRPPLHRRRYQEERAIERYSK